MKRPTRRCFLCLLPLALLAPVVFWFAWGWRLWPRVEVFATPPQAGEPPPFRAVFDEQPGDSPGQNAVAETLARPVARVTDKPHLSPRGDPRDYVSVSIYWWPNPVSGRPWLPRDGQRNPVADEYDAPRLRTMVKTVRVLAAVGREDCDARALEWLRAWFITPETRMHPHLTFAQMMPGLAVGGRQGIIEGLPLVTELLDALAWLDARDVFSGQDRRELRRWFSEYLTWLTRSRAGRAETLRRNNHGTWHDVQLAALGVALGDDALVRNTLERSRARLSVQFLPDGRQPEELRRTKSFGYSLYNLDAWLHLERIGAGQGVSLWSSGPAAGHRYLRDHAGNWPHADIENGNRLRRLEWFENRARRWDVPIVPLSTHP